MLYTRKSTKCLIWKHWKDFKNNCLWSTANYIDRLETPTFYHKNLGATQKKVQNGNSILKRTKSIENLFLKNESCLDWWIFILPALLSIRLICYTSYSWIYKLYLAKRYWKGKHSDILYIINIFMYILCMIHYHFK